MKHRIQVNEYRMHFVRSMEYERFARNLSVRDMAKLVGLSKSSYQRIISNDTESIPFRVVLHVHELTNLPMWQLCGMEMPEEFRQSIDYLRLSKKSRAVVDSVIATLLELESNNEMQEL